MTTNEFIQQHRNDDVRQLAFLAAKYPDVDAAYALDQIRGWQIARKKLSKWAEVDGLQYPPHLSMEQCSSEQTALYKAQIVRRIFDALPKDNADKLFVDLTGGFGVDFSFIAAELNIPSVYVERNENLCRLARNNFPLLGLHMASVVCGNGTEYATTLNRASIVYIDPARRDQHGARTYGIEDCTPNILELLPELMPKTGCVVVKLSPMLDWHSAVEKVDECLSDCSVAEIHIVSVANECKELLMVVAHGGQPLKVVCVNDSQHFSFSPQDSLEQSVYCKFDDIATCYLFEANASIMKAGCFAAVASEYGVSEIGRNSHLFVATNDIPSFPGRRFKIQSVTSLNKKELKQALSGVSKANIATRNFPLSVAELRKKLKLSDGGDVYIFATTMEQNRHMLLICSKC